jgi:hypothetical protein
VGEVVAVAGEHDDVAGTARGLNMLFRFELDGLGFCQLGDHGQRALRPEQRGPSEPTTSSSFRSSTGRPSGAIARQT